MVYQLQLPHFGQRPTVCSIQPSGLPDNLICLSQPMAFYTFDIQALIMPPSHELRPRRSARGQYFTTPLLNAFLPCQDHPNRRNLRQRRLVDTPQTGAPYSAARGQSPGNPPTVPITGTHRNCPHPRGLSGETSVKEQRIFPPQNPSCTSHLSLDTVMMWQVHFLPVFPCRLHSTLFSTFKTSTVRAHRH
jgi:hypothetical protein